MARFGEPERLSARPVRGSAFAKALTAARSREPSSAELDGLARSLASALASPAGVPSSSLPSSSLPSSSLPNTLPTLAAGGSVKAAGVAMALGVALGSAVCSLGVALAPRTSEPAPIQASSAAKRAATMVDARSSSLAPAAPFVSAAPAASVANTPVASVEPASAPPGTRPAHSGLTERSRVQAATSAGAPAQQAPSSASRSTEGSATVEVALIDRARQAIGGSPATALALAEEHERRFPAGTMTEEREVIRIAALMKLGRVADARGRGDAFLRANPGSAHARRVQALLPPAP
jgi:hypothetical protein